MSKFKVGDYVVRKKEHRGVTWCKRFPPGDKSVKVVRVGSHYTDNDLFFEGYRSGHDSWHGEKFDLAKLAPFNEEDYL